MGFAFVFFSSFKLHPRTFFWISRPFSSFRLWFYSSLRCPLPPRALGCFFCSFILQSTTPKYVSFHPILEGEVCINGEFCTKKFRSAVMSCNGKSCLWWTMQFCQLYVQRRSGRNVSNFYIIFAGWAFDGRWCLMEWGSRYAKLRNNFHGGIFAHKNRWRIKNSAKPKKNEKIITRKNCDMPLAITGGGRFIAFSCCHKK